MDSVDETKFLEIPEGTEEISSKFFILCLDLKFAQASFGWIDTNHSDNKNLLQQRTSYSENPVVFACGEIYLVDAEIFPGEEKCVVFILDVDDITFVTNKHPEMLDQSFDGNFQGLETTDLIRLGHFNGRHKVLVFLLE